MLKIIKNKYYKFSKKIRNEILDLINFFVLKKKLLEMQNT